MDLRSLDRALLFGAHAAAGEIQREIAETGASHVSEADLRRAVRSGLQSQLGPVVVAEASTPKTKAWKGRLGPIDVGIFDDADLVGGVEVKWCRDKSKIAEALWDALKLVPLTIDDGSLLAAYLIYGAPASSWESATDLPTELFASAEHDIRALLERHDKNWRWLLTGNKSARPVELRFCFKTSVVAEVPVHDPGGEPWSLKVASIRSEDALMLYFEDGLIAADQPAFGTPAPASRFIDGEGDIQVDPATLPENRGLI